MTNSKIDRRYWFKLVYRHLRSCKDDVITISRVPSKINTPFDQISLDFVNWLFCSGNEEYVTTSKFPNLFKYFVATDRSTAINLLQRFASAMKYI